MEPHLRHDPTLLHLHSMVCRFRTTLRLFRRIQNLNIPWHLRDSWEGSFSSMLFLSFCLSAVVFLRPISTRFPCYVTGVQRPPRNCLLLMFRRCCSFRCIWRKFPNLVIEPVLAKSRETRHLLLFEMMLMMMIVVSQNPFLQQQILFWSTLLINH